MASLPSNNVTIIDNGCDVGFVGNGWTPVKRYDQDVMFKNVMRPQVDAIATLVSISSDGQRRRELVMVARRVIHMSLEQESLLPPDQMRWHGLTVSDKSIHHGGQQNIIGHDFTIPLFWNGETFFFRHTKTKESDQPLNTRNLTGNTPYRPRDYAMKLGLDQVLQDPAQGYVETEPDAMDHQPDDAHVEADETLFHTVPTKDANGHHEFDTNVRVRRRYLWDTTSYNWQPHQMAEWKRRLGHVTEETVKKTFISTTQLVPSLRHENELFPKDSQHISRFPHFAVRRLREEVFCDVVEYPLEGNDKVKQKGLLFYSGSSKILVIYHLGKDATSAKTLECLYEFVRDFGCPDTFVSDFDQVLVKSDKWARFCRVTLCKARSSEAGKQQSNRVERAWQDLQRRGQFLTKSLYVPKTHRFDMYAHLCDCHNHTALSSLNWRTPMETMTGDTPDISVFRYSFWEQVWYKEKSGVGAKQVNWVKGRFLGIAWSTGDTMCYRVLPEVSYQRTVHRTIVLSRHIDENMPREILTQPSDFFFPTPKATTPSPTSNSNVGRKRHIDELNEDADDSDGETTDGETQDDVPLDEEEPPKAKGPIERNLRKRFLEEAKEYDQSLNELSTPLANLMDTETVDKILGYSLKKEKKTDNDKSYMFRVQMMNGSTIKNVSLDDLKVDAPVALSRYILQSTTLSKVPKLHKYAAAINKLHEKILRLTSDRERKLGITSDIIKEAGTVSSRRRVSGPQDSAPRRTKKLSRNKRKSNSMGGFKYGVYIPKSVAEAKLVDKKNGNNLWIESIVKEIKAMWSMKTFKIMTKSEKTRLRDDYQIAPLRCIFDVKQDLRRKARLIIGGHVIDSTGHDLYASNMKTISARVLMLLASANKLDVLTGDISNAYLYATGSQQVAVKLGEEFNLYDESIPVGSYASVEQALYGLPTSANRWHAHLADTLRVIGFRPTRYDPDVWIRAQEDHHEYIGTHTDDLMVVSKNPQGIMDTLSKTYKIAKIGPPKFHLGCDYIKNVDGTWSIGTKTYVNEALQKVKAILKQEDKDGVSRFGKEPIPMRTDSKLENDLTDLCGIEEHRTYQQLVGIAQWLITCGRLDLSFAISSLSRFSHAPRQGHLAAAVRVFKYLNANADKWIRLDPSTHKPPGPLEEPNEIKDIDWSQQYPEAYEELDVKFPKPLGKALTTAVYFDSNWAHDEQTRKSISGVICYIGNTPVSWLSKHQGAIATSTYSAELNSAKVGCEEAIGIRYMLRSLGVPLTGPTILAGDNLGALQSSTNPGSECKKRHVNIAYHYTRECNAAGIVKIYKIHTDHNPSDPFTKACPKDKFWAHFKPIFGNAPCID